MLLLGEGRQEEQTLGERRKGRRQAHCSAAASFAVDSSPFTRCSWVTAALSSRCRSLLPLSSAALCSCTGR